jgi:predicted RNase H-like HicB family nuclease
MLNMEKIKYVYYKEDNMWVGWLDEYPDYRTQAKTIEELKGNLKEIYEELSTGKIPHARRHGELAVVCCQPAGFLSLIRYLFKTFRYSFKILRFPSQYIGLLSFVVCFWRASPPNRFLLGIKSTQTFT